MKRFKIHGGTVIQAFRFNGSLDQQSYEADNLPPPWFAEGYFKKQFREFFHLASQSTCLRRTSRSDMGVGVCRPGDWVCVKENDPEKTVFFIWSDVLEHISTRLEDMPVPYPSLTDANNARQKEWDTGAEKMSLSFKGNELAGEVGELCNVLKKLERERLGIPGSRDTVEHAAEEMADVVICVDLIASHLGVDLWQAVAKKFNATSEKNGMKTRMVVPNGNC